ncbi:hypothetical protein P7K49_026705, partial [Saguinus oedipus]
GPTGVLTKPDLVDKGTECEVIRGTNLLSHLNDCMILKCPSHQDIQDWFSLTEVLQKEFQDLLEEERLSFLAGRPPNSL